ncbi:histone-like nucleoid-structuring protein Lsr2 [Streptomyces noursei]|uniref:Lsr2 family DNA-binding protein n=1 Tax=Streptomyces noursei TaxID=1971 RepID=UPI0033FA6958
MRKTVQVISYVEKTICDGCHAKNGVEAEASDVLSLGGRSWDLCGSHAERFGAWLADALNLPDADAVPVEVEPSPAAAVDDDDDREQEERSEEATDPQPVLSVMISGEVDGYDWEDARQAVRNLGYEVVGRADESTVLLILGEGGERNGTKLRDASERGIPCMDVRQPGRFKAAVVAGEFVGGDPLPEPAKVGPKVMSERERNRAVRAWARENGYVVPSKGRIPMHVKHAYEMTHRDVSQGKAVAA